MRLDYRAVMPEALTAMQRLQAVAEMSGLEPKLLELVKLRASQINGCAYCLDLPTKHAMAIGEDVQRLTFWRPGGKLTFTMRGSGPRWLGAKASPGYRTQVPRTPTSNKLRRSFRLKSWWL